MGAKFFFRFSDFDLVLGVLYIAVLIASLLWQWQSNLLLATPTTPGTGREPSLWAPPGSLSLLSYSPRSILMALCPLLGMCFINASVSPQLLPGVVASSSPS